MHSTAQTWRRVWGTEKISRTKISLNDDFFWKKFPFSRPKFSDDFFSHRPGFSDFPLFTVIKCPIVYDPFYARKPTFSKKNSLIKPFFNSVHPFAHIQQHYFSKYWGDQCMGRPPPQIFLGGPSPSPPRSPPLGFTTRVETPALR